MSLEENNMFLLPIIFQVIKTSIINKIIVFFKILLLLFSTKKLISKKLKELYFFYRSHIPLYELFFRIEMNLELYINITFSFRFKFIVKT